MGAERVSSSTSQPPGGGGENRSAPLTYTEIFNENFPYYLMLGMTYEQYWYGDCQLVVYYRKADVIRQERIDSGAWLQGLYNFRAIAATLSKEAHYPENPFTLTYTETPEEKQVNPNKIAMEVFMVNYNEQYNRKQAKAGEKDSG